MNIHEAVRRAIGRAKDVDVDVSKKEELGIRNVILAIVKEFPGLLH